MTTDTPRHRWLGYENSTPGRFVARCSCGWRSAAYTSAGLAGAAADRHKAEAETGDDEPT